MTKIGKLGGKTDQKLNFSFSIFLICVGRVRVRNFLLSSPHFQSLTFFCSSLNCVRLPPSNLSEITPSNFTRPRYVGEGKVCRLPQIILLSKLIKMGNTGWANIIDLNKVD